MTEQLKGALIQIFGMLDYCKPQDGTRPMPPKELVYYYAVSYVLIGLAVYAVS